MAAHRLSALLLATALVLGGRPARADDAGPSGDAPKLRDLCTDRPTKNTGACTVDPGHVQIESDLFNVTFDRSGGVDTNTYLITNPTLKYGLSRTLDLEASIAPLVVVTTRDRASGVTGRTTGVGDLYLRAKWNLAGDDGGAVSVALLPYLKVPTAPRGIGDRAVEGGLLLPVSITLPAKFSLAFTPEVDWLKNADDDGRHANMVQLVALGHPLGPVNLTAELWSDLNFDPAGEITQYSADLGVAWIPKHAPNLQFDGGVNLGLNRVTPGVQAYVGVSRRF